VLDNPRPGRQDGRALGGRDVLALVRAPAAFGAEAGALTTEVEGATDREPVTSLV
jgi:hypothetical protein